MIKVPKQEIPATILVNIDWIYPNPRNPRKNFNQSALEELAQSIREVGILQPLVVVADKVTLDKHYRLIAGERRWRASQLAGLKTVPAIVRDLTPRQEAEVMLIENLQREDLDPVEESRALRELLDNHDYTQEHLAGKLGISQSHIANRIRLLRLPDDIQDNISRKIISAGHALALLRLEKHSELLKAALEEIVEHQVAITGASHVVDVIIRHNGRPLFKEAYPQPVFNHQKECIKCANRLNAKDHNDKEHPYCVDIGCWDKKQAAVEEKNREKRIAQMEKERRQKLTEQGASPEQIEQEVKQISQAVDTSKLHYNDYETLSEYTKFDKTECDGCPKNRLGQYGSTGSLKTVCLDKPCYDKKSRAAQAVANKELREQKKTFEALKERAIELRGDIYDRTVVIYMVARVLEHPVYSSFDWSRDKIRKAFYKSQGWPEKEAGQDEHAAVIKRLETLDVHELTKALLWLLVKPSDNSDNLVKWWLDRIPGLYEGETGRELTEEEEFWDRTLHPNVIGVLHCSCDDGNFKSAVSKLTDDELTYCIKKEVRVTALQKLKAEAKRRGLNLQEAS